ncbi:MAG TPA: glycosyltransferase, partial [Acidobacteriota bacterium]|nr:glycosyltransferase [Acidobacteriota bacterium]
IPQSTLLICGGGPDEHSLRELAHSLGVSTHVRFVKHIRLEELPLYLAASTVFVRASRSEGFGNSFIEAMAFGIPVVATRVGGIADFLTTKTGFECEVNNPNSIANAIFSLLSEPKQTAAIVKNAKSFVVSEYDWKKVSKKYDALFKEMLR